MLWFYYDANTMIPPLVPLVVVDLCADISIAINSESQRGNELHRGTTTEKLYKLYKRNPHLIRETTTI